MDKSCATCMWFNGQYGDGQQFCDDKESYVGENFYCSRYCEDEIKVSWKEDYEKEV